jgi:TolB protein
MRRLTCLAFVLLVACSDDPAGPDADPDPLTKASAALVSAPVAPAPGSPQTSSVRTSGPRVFVSMPPGTEPGGASVTIRVKGTDASVSAPMIDGGFDPVAVEADAGDSLAITLTRPSGSETGYARVPADSRPVVVRTSPRHRRVDVPLNPVVVIVFNQPMDPGTLAPAIRLRSAGVEFAGTVTAVVTGADVLSAEFVPEGLLAAGTTYALEVSTAAASREGTPLASPVRTEFTTGDDVADATLVVSTTTTGSEVDPNGYDVVVDDAAPHSIDINGTLSIPVTAGPHTVTLSGVAANCTTTGATREIAVETGATATVSFSVACSGATTSGAVRVITSTTGTDLDSDAYQVQVGAASRPIGLNDAVVVTSLGLGTHTAVLSGVSPNCLVQGGTRRPFTVILGGSVDVTFDITCSSNTTGSLVVRTITAGPDPDADGYSVIVDGGPGQPIDPSGTIQLALTAESHTVELTGISGNCRASPAGYFVPDGELSPGSLNTIDFWVGCNWDFRPSGTVAFTTQIGSTWSIFTSQADGSGRELIASGTGQIGQLASTPDGTRLAFNVSSSEGSDIFVVGADGSNLLRRTDTGWNSSPTWSPDGRRVAFGSLRDGRWGVYVMDVDGDWRDVDLIGPLLALDPRPAWSPDGTTIAFVNRVLEPIDNGTGVYLVRPDGSGVVPLPPEETAFRASGGGLAWSPDGATLAVTGWAGWNGETDVFLVRIDGSSVVSLGQWDGWKAGAWDPAWSADGTTIAVTAYEVGAVPFIRFVTPDGRGSSVRIDGAQGVVWRP